MERTGDKITEISVSGIRAYIASAAPHIRHLKHVAPLQKSTENQPFVQQKFLLNTEYSPSRSLHRGEIHTKIDPRTNRLLPKNL